MKGPINGSWQKDELSVCCGEREEKKQQKKKTAKNIESEPSKICFLQFWQGQVNTVWCSFVLFFLGGEAKIQF